MKILLLNLIAMLAVMTVVSVSEINAASSSSILVNIVPENPVWQAILCVLEAARQDERQHALLADLTAEARAYNCGRAAALENLCLTLPELQAKAAAERTARERQT